MKTMEELYARLVRAHEAFAVWLHPLQFGGDSAREERRKRAGELANGFMEYFCDKRIYFEEGLCAIIDEAIAELKKAWVVMDAYPPGMPERGEQWSKTWERFAGLLPPIIQRVERQFRDLAGVLEKEGGT